MQHLLSNADANSNANVGGCGRALELPYQPHAVVMQPGDQRQGGYGPEPSYGAQPGMYSQQRPAAGMQGQPGPAHAQPLPRPPMQPQQGGFGPSGLPSGPLQRPSSAAFAGMTLSNGPPQGALPRPPPGMQLPGLPGHRGQAMPQSSGVPQSSQPSSAGPTPHGSFPGARAQPAAPPGGFQQPQARPGFGALSQQGGSGFSMPRGPPGQRPSFAGAPAQRPLAPGQPGPGLMQPPGPGLANGHATGPYSSPPPQSGQARPGFLPSPPSPQPTSIGFGAQPGQYGQPGQPMPAQRPTGPPPGTAPPFRGRPPAPGMPGGVPSFGSGPDSVLPGGRAMAAPLGGGEYVQDNRRSPNRIEPHSMPRPGTSLADPPLVFYTRVDDQHAVPPPASSRYIVKDTGDCSPRCMRATLNAMPATSDLCKTGAMPMSVVISPLALPDPLDDPIQVVDPGQEGPVRCRECKAYMNPHMLWRDAGRSFVCTFCGSTTPTPHDYIEHIGPDGRRRDAAQRPELSCGSYELVAGPQFQVRPCMVPTHVFLIDVSHTAVHSGATAAACAAVTSILDDLQGTGTGRQHIGVVTFDSAIHFYSFIADRTGYHMLLVPDGERPFAPAASSSLVVPLQAASDTVKSLLGQIPELFKGQTVIDTCLGGAVDACIQLLKGGTGGKLQVFASVLPKVGKAPLVPRDQTARSTGDKDVQKAQEPATKAYRDMAADAAEFQVCIDLFVTSQGYVDLATLRDLCHLTAGQLYHYHPFSPDLDTNQLTNDLRWNVVRPQGWEAVGRLRVSAGLDIERYAGSFFRRTASDMDFPALSADHSFAIQLRHDGSLNTGRPVLIQYALVYSTASGHRRIRVHTMALPAVDKLGNVFRGADLEASLSVLAVNMAAKIPSGTLAAAKETAAKTMIDVLHSYRRNCSTQSAPGQLVLPEALKLAPLYHLCLQKCLAFRPDSSPDTRALWLHRLTASPVARLMRLVHGTLLPLHDLLNAAAAGQPIGQGPDIIPEACAGLTAEKLREDGIFLWTNGSEAILFFGQRVPPPLIHATIGQDTVDMRSNVEALRWPLGVPKLDTAPNRALQAVLDELRRQRGAYMFLRVARRGDAVESAFYSNLIEDKTSAGTSYVDFLVAVHRRIAELSK